jgi:Xaa-Pro aminopeptidase
VEAVRPGVACQEIDRAARKEITGAGYGEQISSTAPATASARPRNEPPYMIEGEQRPDPARDVFLRRAGHLPSPAGSGSRIEDIVKVTETVWARLNNTDRHLRIVE